MKETRGLFKGGRFCRTLLTRGQRLAFEWLYRIGESVREVARRFGVTASAIYVRIHRARRRLRLPCIASRLTPWDRERYAPLLRNHA